MHQPVRRNVPVLTILLNPVHSKNAAVPLRAETFARAISQDETVLPTRWFPSVADFVQYALAVGWREKYRCIVHVTPHPADLPGI
jgi:hypothetical protein